MNEEETCRICLEPAEPDYPLFEPCKCLGTVAFVHTDCLLMWHSKLKKRELLCDMCRAPIIFANPLDFEPQIERHHYATYFRHIGHNITEWYKSFSILDVDLDEIKNSTLFKVLIIGPVYLSAVGLLRVLLRCLVATSSVKEYDSHWESVCVLEKMEITLLGVLETLLVIWPCCVVAGEVWTELLKLREQEQQQQDHHHQHAVPNNNPAQGFVETHNPARRYISALVHSLRHEGLAFLNHRSAVYVDTHLITFMLTLLTLVLAGAWRCLIENYRLVAGLEHVLTCWKPRVIEDVSTDRFFAMMVLLYLWHLLAVLSDPEDFPARAALHTCIILVSTVVIPIFHSAALFYAATGQLAIPSYWQAWAYWLVGAACWYDWQDTRSQLMMPTSLPTSHATALTTYTRATYPNVLLDYVVWPFIQFLPTTLNHSLIVWSFTTAMQPTLACGDLRWYALALVALMTPLGPKQPPLSYVAWVWFEEVLWTRLIARRLIARLPIKNNKPAIVPMARSWFLVAVFGVVPLSIGRLLSGWAASHLDPPDLLLWAYPLCLGLPALGFLLLEYPPEELRYSARFLSWQKAQSVEWHRISASLVLGICEKFVPQDALIEILVMVWPVQGCTNVLLPMITRSDVLLVACMRRWPVTWLHFVMRRTYPRTLVNYRDQQRITERNKPGSVQY